MSEPNDKDPLGEIYDAAAEYVRDRVKTLDQWAQDNPEHAAAVGFVIGLATSVVFNKALMIRGVVATASATIGAVKGAAVGYSYAKARCYAVDRYGDLRNSAAYVRDAVSQTGEDLAMRTAKEFRRWRGPNNTPGG